jgi:phasin family protein
MTTQKKKANGNDFANGWNTAAWNDNASFEKLADAGRENMEAIAAATSIAAEGFGAVNQAWLSFAKSAMERNGAAVEAIFASKDAASAAELQADWARSAFDNYVTESSKISEMAVKTANDAIAPIRARVDGAVEKFADSAS